MTLGLTTSRDGAEQAMRSFGNLAAYLGKRGLHQEHIRLCLGPFLFTLIDYALTLCNQPSLYWAGHYQFVDEGSVPLRWCLQQHPLVFVAAAGVIALIFNLLILCWPREPALIVAGVVMFGHAYGAATWLVHSAVFGYVALVLSIYVVKVLIDSTWTVGRRRETIPTSR